MVVEIFEVVVGGCRWFKVVFRLFLSGFRSFHVLVLTQNFNERQRFIL